MRPFLRAATWIPSIYLCFKKAHVGEQNQRPGKALGHL